MQSPYSPTGTVHQSAIIDAMNENQGNRLMSSIFLGIVQDVYTTDNTSVPGVLPRGAYTLYSVELSPLGAIVKNVPSIMLGGHLNTPVDGLFGLKPINDQLSGLPTPAQDVQNIEETPYVIGQPVLVAFIGNSHFNPVIIGAMPIPSQINGATIGQTNADYPRKYGSFQGASWFVDKVGNAEMNLPSTASLTIRIGGQIFCIIKNGEVDLGGDNAATQPTILGDALNTYLTNFINATFNLHTHTGGTILGLTGPPSPLGTPPSGIETTVVRVK